MGDLQRSATKSTTRRQRRRRVWLAALISLLAVALWASEASAQKVLLAPKVDLSFETLRVTGQDDAVRVEYELAERDWQWAQDMGMDLWAAAYRSSGDGGWRLERAARMDAAAGEARLAAPGGGQLGVCLVAMTEGGHLAPGMGYICDQPISVAVSQPNFSWKKTDARVSMRYERHVDEQPWFGPKTGFVQTLAAAEQAAPATEGAFVAWEAPQPPTPVARVGEPRLHQRDYDYERLQAERMQEMRECEDCEYPYGYGYGYYGLPYVADYYRSGFMVPGARYSFDRFRQRQLDRSRMFPPTFGFDAQFNHDMFTTHPDDVFYNFPVTPGYFGRDAFGRSLDHGFTSPRRSAPRPGLRGPSPGFRRGGGPAPAGPRALPHGTGHGPGPGQ